MAQKILIVLTALAALVLNIAQANSAQLSTNPWLEANDDEAVAEVYRKEQRRKNLRSLNYQAEGTATIDRTHAYIQDAGENGATEEDEGLLDKVKDAFGGDDGDESRHGGRHWCRIPRQTAGRWRSKGRRHRCSRRIPALRCRRLISADRLTVCSAVCSYRSCRA